LFDIFYIIC